VEEDVEEEEEEEDRADMVTVANWMYLADCSHAEPSCDNWEAVCG
jgi:hypothetical protein